MDSQGICRGVWAGLEDSRERTLGEITAFNMPAAAVAKWLQALIVNGYVRMGYRIANGSAETTFRLSRYTGPLAPHLDESGTFVDPNLIKRGNRTDPPQKGVALAAQVHAISRRLKSKWFSRAWMLEQVGQRHSRRLTETCRSLIRRGFIAPGQDDETFLVMEGNSTYDAVHAAVIEKANKGPFTFGEIAEMLNIQMASRTIGFIMDWVRADGYIVTRSWNHRTGSTVYRVSSASKVAGAE